MIATDFLLDSNGDLLIENGDFVTGPSDNQHIQDIIAFNTGYLKQFPQVGVGITNYEKSVTGAAALEANIKQQLKADGYTINNVSVFFQGGNLKIQLGTQNNPIVRP